MNYLYKKDAVINLYPLQEGEDYFEINITHINGGNFFGKWIEFQPELDELRIIESDDDWMCVDEDANGNIITREELKVKLEARGFNVQIKN